MCRLSFASLFQVITIHITSPWLCLSGCFVFVFSSSLHSPQVRLSGWQLHSALLSRPLNQSGPELPRGSHHCTFPPLSIQGLREAESMARPMREQRRLEPTNQRPASWDAPAELAARHHFEKERPRLPPLHDGAGELPGGHHPHLHPPKAGSRPYTAPPQCILARSFKGPFWPSKGFPIELCILQLLFAARHSTATSTAELCRIAAELLRRVGRAGPGRILPLANYLDLSPLLLLPTNSRPVSDSSLKGQPNTKHYTPRKPLGELWKF